MKDDKWCECSQCHNDPCMCSVAQAPSWCPSCKDLRAQLAKARRKREEAEASRERLRLACNMGPEWSGALDRADAAESERDLAEKAVSDLMDKYSELEADYDRYRDAFRNFHRSLCDRFSYSHDSEYFWRDLISLEEHIAQNIDRWREEAVQLREALSILDEQCIFGPLTTNIIRKALDSTPHTGAVTKLIKAAEKYRIYRDSDLPIDGVIDKLEDEIYEASKALRALKETP